MLQFLHRIWCPVFFHYDFSFDAGAVLCLDFRLQYALLSHLVVVHQDRHCYPITINKLELLVANKRKVAKLQSGLICRLNKQCSRLLVKIVFETASYSLFQATSIAPLIS